MERHHAAAFIELSEPTITNQVYGIQRQDLDYRYAPIVGATTMIDTVVVGWWAGLATLLESLVEKHLTQIRCLAICRPPVRGRDRKSPLIYISWYINNYG